MTQIFRRSIDNIIFNQVIEGISYHMNDFFLSCDWGTSSLRLRLIEASSGSIEGEVIAGDGIAKVYSQWGRLQEKPDRFGYFQKCLSSSIAKLEARCAVSCEGLILIISGMASSSIGMLEVPYATLPLALSEKALPKQFLPAQAAFPYHTLLISGLRTRDDVMRGEETELIGLARETDYTFEEGVYIFPGTHSKHIEVQNHQIIGFHTFVTGELFDLLTSHSTLKASVDRPEKFDKACQDAFVMGVQASRKYNFLTGLFKTRTNQLLEKLDFYENYYYLSGLITGMELSNAKSYKNMVVCAGAKFVEPYRLGAAVLGLSEKCQFVPVSEVALLVCRGHQKIYENLNIKDHL